MLQVGDRDDTSGCQVCETLWPFIQDVQHSVWKVNGASAVGNNDSQLFAQDLAGRICNKQRNDAIAFHGVCGADCTGLAISILATSFLHGLEAVHRSGAAKSPLSRGPHMPLAEAGGAAPAHRMV